MTGAEAIAAERQRQIKQEGWTHEHDDQHTDGSLSGAAAAYALNASSKIHDPSADDTKHPHSIGWMWSLDWWKPKDTRADLVRAGALIAAEIDRLDRLAAAPKP